MTGANISVRINDKFMQAVEQQKSYTQQFPVDSKTPSTQKEVDALAIWKKIVHNAWKSAALVLHRFS